MWKTVKDFFSFNVISTLVYGWLIYVFLLIVLLTLLLPFWLLTKVIT